MGIILNVFFGILFFCLAFASFVFSVYANSVWNLLFFACGAISSFFCAYCIHSFFFAIESFI